MKLGYNLDNPHLIEGKRASASESSAIKLVKKSKTHIRRSYLDRMKLAKIAQRLEKVIFFQEGKQSIIKNI